MKGKGERGEKETKRKKRRLERNLYAVIVSRGSLY